jgi:hypothetical protein
VFIPDEESVAKNLPVSFVHVFSFIFAVSLLSKIADRIDRFSPKCDFGLTNKPMVKQKMQHGGQEVMRSAGADGVRTSHVFFFRVFSFFQLKREGSEDSLNQRTSFNVYCNLPFQIIQISNDYQKVKYQN